VNELMWCGDSLTMLSGGSLTWWCDVVARLCVMFDVVSAITYSSLI
jgi:hypothetical protein